MAGRAAEFVNYIGRNVVVASRSGPVETVPTVPVATALQLSHSCNKMFRVPCTPIDIFSAKTISSDVPPDSIGNGIPSTAEVCSS